MNNIEFIIDKNNYIESLLEYGLNNNLISQNEYDFIINKIIELLEFKVKKYTAGLTNSILIRELKSINISNLYVLGLYLKNRLIEESIIILLSEDIIELYTKSRKELEKRIEKIKLFYNVVVLNNLVNTDNYFYNATLKQGIKGFFKLYNPDYMAYNINITVDYELFLFRPNSKGIEFIEEYLKYINIENIFCQKFDYVLSNKDLPISIYEMVFTKAIIENTNGFDRNSLLKAYQKLKEEKNLNNEYYDNSAVIIIDKIIFNYKNNTLEQIEKKITYKPNPKMNTLKYMQLIDELTNDMDGDTIINNISSILDLIDIFDSFNIPTIELNKIFNSLNLVEIMVLKNYYSLCDSYIIKELDNYILHNNKIIILNNYKNIIIRT